MTTAHSATSPRSPQASTLRSASTAMTSAASTPATAGTARATGASMADAFDASRAFVQARNRDFRVTDVDTQPNTHRISVRHKDLGEMQFVYRFPTGSTPPSLERVEADGSKRSVTREEALKLRSLFSQTPFAVDVQRLAPGAIGLWSRTLTAMLQSDLLAIASRG